MGKKKIAKEVAALKAAVADLKKQIANLQMTQAAKLKSEIDNLDNRLHTEFEQIKQKSKREEKQVKGKQVQALGRKAAKAKGETKAATEARMTNIQNKSNDEYPKYTKESTTSFEESQEAKKGKQKISA